MHDAHQGMLHEDPRPPFGRRVIERVARGLAHVKESTRANSAEPIIEKSDEGLNANTCAVLAKMGELIKEQPIAYSITWAPKLAPSKDVKGVRKVVLERKSYQTLRSAETKLKKIERPVIEVYGHVMGGHSAVPLLTDVDDETAARTIEIDWRQKGRSRKVRVRLNAATYRTALEAHQEGRPVLVTGVLNTQSHPATLLYPADFRVVDLTKPVPEPKTKRKKKS